MFNVIFKWLDKKLNLKLRNWSIWGCLITSIFFATPAQIMLFFSPKEFNFLLTDLKPKRFSYQKSLFYYHWNTFKVYFNDEKKAKITLLWYGIDDLLKDKSDILWENYQFDVILAPYEGGKYGGYISNAGILYRIIAPNGYAVFINQEAGSFRLRIFIQRLFLFLIFLNGSIFNLCAFYRIRFIIRRDKLEALERQANRKRLNQALQNKNK